jgi:hypothetical protein
VILFPDQHRYFVDKLLTLETLERWTPGFKLRYVGVHQQPGNDDEDIYKLIPFIPPNYPVNPGRSTEYPYDMISVRMDISPFDEMNVHRHTLIQQIYARYRTIGDKTTAIQIPSLGNEEIRLQHIGGAPDADTTLDALSDPRTTAFMIDRLSGVLVAEA